MSITPPAKDPFSTLNLNLPYLTYPAVETELQETHNALFDVANCSSPPSVINPAELQDSHDHANDEGYSSSPLSDYRFTNHDRIDQPMMAIVESLDTHLMINCNIFMEATT